VDQNIGSEDNESIDEYIRRRNTLPDLLKDHVSWLKWFLAEAEREEEERSTWWFAQPRKEEEPPLEWDKTWFELRVTVWNMRLFQLKQTVRKINLDSKDLDIIATREYRDTLAYFEEKETALREGLENVKARLSRGSAKESVTPSKALPPDPQYSRGTFSKTTIGKWLSVNPSSDEKDYRERTDRIIERFPSLLQKVGERSYRVSYSILRDVWDKERITPFERPRFEGE
jgi:hypothetical protein